jgi:uncharacterized NAD(P)/FAD-binding protein YdhS
MQTHESKGRGAAPLRIALCGGGAAAVLVLQALRQQARGAVEVVIFEPREQLGVGVAYSTRCPRHLLNTRACNMSVTDDPDDFVHWLRAKRPRRILNWSRDDFAPRSYYGEYLQERLADAQSAPHIKVQWVRSLADSVNPLGDKWEIVPAQGDPHTADAVIIATGNEPPRPLASGLPLAAQSLVIDDPWDAEQKNTIPKDAPVLLAGTGLTAIDVVIELLHRGHSGPITAISRRGLLPRPHGPIAPAREGMLHALPSSLSALVRHVRELSANDEHGEKWRRVMTELRGITPSLWRGLSTAERRRFLRHVQPFWDVHRHRLPPAVHTRIQRAITSRQLTVLRGRIQSLEPIGSESLRVITAYRGNIRALHVARVVNCTGPTVNPLNSANPLLHGLVSDGTARPDALGLGLGVDQDSRVIAANGSAHATLYALGALTRGSRWEVTAMLELRDQASSVVRNLLHTYERSAMAEYALAAAGVTRPSSDPVSSPTPQAQPFAVGAG